MRHSFLFLSTALLLFATSSALAQLSPDDVAGARRLLQQQRGGWQGYDNLRHAKLLIERHEYREAQRVVDNELRRLPATGLSAAGAALRAEWLALKTRLLIQAWRLDEAMQLARSIPHPVLIGRIQLLQKNYAAALTAAKAAQAARPNDAEAHLLEADVHFWNQTPELAEAPLRRALELDPLNADARFAYGYAIWRRVDARQLPAMAAQWNLALNIDPLHYVTHWHFGNGHTHLTYADYAHATDTIVRLRLRGVDSLLAQRRMGGALQRTRALQSEFPHSVLPELARGSIFYMAYDMPRGARLDSAQTAFMSVLSRKPNYGPAHNALAAVIKQRQFTYVAQFDSLESEIARQPMPQDSAFYRVFKNIRYYPGDRVTKMAVQQLGPALAYIPFIARMGYTYVIPPLHHDLTEAMSNPFYRTSTTFDNRQWMDIRGSGGNHASAGIEYVERGSHQERVVLLHEYVHQFHGAVLTDKQNRRIRQLYYDAMANNRTLDYYAANNESEFFAQSYEAYLSPVKVHPLNHKAMNTRADLIAKDPELFAFLDTLITENRAYLAGDREAMRQNWAQVYVSLARQARGLAQRSADSLRWRRPQALLDTAFTHDPNYVPALLEGAALMQAQQRWAEAGAALDRAAALAPDYAPVFTARSTLLRDRALAEKSSGAVEERIALYKRALAVETDLSERAELNRILRELYFEQTMFAEALQIADEYVATAATPSTYLRDRKDEAAAFAAELRATLGETSPAVTFFEGLLQRKPQHFGHRAQAARVLLLAGEPQRALQVIQEGRTLLGSAGQQRADYAIAEAEALAALKQVDSAKAVLRATMRANTRPNADDRMRLMTVLASIGMTTQTDSLLQADTGVVSPRLQAELSYIRGLLHHQRQQLNEARAHYEAALRLNAQHNRARMRLQELPRSDAADVKAFPLLGRVLDVSSKLPVSTAVVRFKESRRAALTDSLGRFIIPTFKPGTDKVEVSRIGYITWIEDIELQPGDSLVAHLIPQPITLEGIVAVVNRLESRRRSVPMAVRAFDKKKLALAFGDMSQFLRSQGVSLSSCPQSAGSAGSDFCVYSRGRYRPVTVFVDEMPVIGAPLHMYYPQEFEVAEYYPGSAMVRLYTSWYLSRVARGKAQLSPILW